MASSYPGYDDMYTHGGYDDHWKSIPIVQWKVKDVVYWIRSLSMTADQCNFISDEICKYQITGAKLSKRIREAKSESEAKQFLIDEWMIETPYQDGPATPDAIYLDINVDSVIPWPQQNKNAKKVIPWPQK